jgi:integrase
VLGELKTPASRRVIPLAKGTVAALRMHRARQREDYLAICMRWGETAQVFSTADGALVDPGTVSSSFHRLLDRAGLPRVRVHDLRHMVSSFLQSRGRSDREAQKILGHASEIATRRIYTHVMPNRRKSIMEPIEELFPTDTEAV